MNSSTYFFTYFVIVSDLPTVLAQTASGRLPCCLDDKQRGEPGKVHPPTNATTPSPSRSSYTRFPPNYYKISNNTLGTVAVQAV